MATANWVPVDLPSRFPLRGAVSSPARVGSLIRWRSCLAILLGDPGDDRMRRSPTRVVVSSMGAPKDLNFIALDASCSRYRRVLSGPSLFHSLSAMCFLDPALESPGRTPVSVQLGCLPHPCQRCPLSATGRSASAREPISPNPLRASTDAEVSSSCASGHQR